MAKTGIFGISQSTASSVGVENRPTLIRATTGATIAAGARSVSFFNSGSTDTPTIDGVVLKQGETVSFNAGGESDTLIAIVYDVPSGELLIATIRL